MSNGEVAKRALLSFDHVNTPCWGWSVTNNDTRVRLAIIRPNQHSVLRFKWLKRWHGERRAAGRDNVDLSQLYDKHSIESTRRKIALLSFDQVNKACSCSSVPNNDTRVLLAITRPNQHSVLRLEWLKGWHGENRAVGRDNVDLSQLYDKQSTESTLCVEVKWTKQRHGDWVNVFLATSW